MSGMSEGRSRIHPPAMIALIVSIVGIPLVGLITGAIAVVLAAASLSCMAGDPQLRGRGMAMAAVLVGLGDMILWAVLPGLMVPHVHIPVLQKGEHLIFPSAGFPANAPPPIKRALENNVFLVVKRDRWPPFLTAETISGSGVVLGRTETSCLILTSRHVVDPSFTNSLSSPPDTSASITAYFHNGAKSPAHIRWTAPGGADLALVATGEPSATVPVPDLHPLRRTEIGEKVFTVGNPHDLTWTYNEGVISAVREISLGNRPIRVYQTQTPINVGNSGGGLYSQDGTLIGIVTWTKDKSQAEGISFAIAYMSFLQLL